MRIKKRLAILALTGAMALSACAAGCSKQAEEKSTVSTETAQSTQPSEEISESTSEVSQESSAPEQSSESEKSTASQLSQVSAESSAAQESKTESKASAPVAEESLTETQKKVRSIIESGGSEKDIYDKIFNMNEYRSSGHVITDVDNDGKYELITRDADRSEIMIYKISGKDLLEKKFDDPKLGFNSVRVDMRYSILNKDVFFTTLGTNDNQFFKMKIFKFTPGQFLMKKSDDVTFTVDENRRPDYSTLDEAGKNACLKLSGTWTESFNDSCTEGAPSNSVEIPKDMMSKYVTDFPLYYYDSSDINSSTMVKFPTDNSSYGLPLHTIQTLLLNEIYARHGMKSSYPHSIAFFNKKNYYTELFDSSYFGDNVVDSSEFNDYERTAIKTFNYVDNPAGQA